MNAETSAPSVPPTQRVLDLAHELWAMAQGPQPVADAVERIARQLSAAQPAGEVVVTKNEAGQIVAVTRQDDEGRILSVISESARPAPSSDASSDPPTIPDLVLACVHAYGDSRADDDGTSGQHLRHAVEELRNWCGDTIAGERQKRVSAEQRAEYWKAEHLAGNAALESLRKQHEEGRRLLDEVRQQFTRDDDLPDDLLPRIDAALGEA